MSQCLFFSNSLFYLKFVPKNHESVRSKMYEGQGERINETKKTRFVQLYPFKTTDEVKDLRNL